MKRVLFMNDSGLELKVFFFPLFSFHVSMHHVIQKFMFQDLNTLHIQIQHYESITIADCMQRLTIKLWILKKSRRN